MLPSLEFPASIASILQAYGTAFALQTALYSIVQHRHFTLSPESRLAAARAGAAPDSSEQGHHETERFSPAQFQLVCRSSGDLQPSIQSLPPRPQIRTSLVLASSESSFRISHQRRRTCRTRRSCTGASAANRKPRLPHVQNLRLPYAPSSALRPSPSQPCHEVRSRFQRDASE
jgi:hypothetical protein